MDPTEEAIEQLRHRPQLARLLMKPTTEEVIGAWLLNHPEPLQG